MAKNNNSFLKNGIVWKIILTAVGIGAAWGAFHLKTSQTATQCDKNTDDIVEIKIQTGKDITELKTGIIYITEAIKDASDRQDRSLEEIKKELRAIPVW